MFCDYGLQPPNTCRPTLWTWVALQSPRWPVSHKKRILPASCAWSLTWQSSVNYPVTDNLAVISQTIKQAIKLFWIASSGPERLPTVSIQQGVKAAPALHDIGLIYFFIYPAYLFVCAWLSPGERFAESSKRAVLTQRLWESLTQVFPISSHEVSSSFINILIYSTLQDAAVGIKLRALS